MICVEYVINHIAGYKYILLWFTESTLHQDLVKHIVFVESEKSVVFVGEDILTNDVIPSLSFVLIFLNEKLCSCI